MSQEPIVIPLSAPTEVFGILRSNLDELKRQLASIESTSITAGLTRQMATLEVSVLQLGAAIQTESAKIAKSMAKGIKDGADEGAATVRAFKQQMQGEYEALRESASKPISIKVLAQYADNGVTHFPDDSLRYKEYKDTLELKKRAQDAQLAEQISDAQLLAEFQRNAEQAHMDQVRRDEESAQALKEANLLDKLKRGMAVDAQTYSEQRNLEESAQALKEANLLDKLKRGMAVDAQQYAAQRALEESAQALRAKGLRDSATMQMDRALYSPQGQYSTVKTGALNLVKNADLDMTMPSKALFEEAKAANAAMDAHERLTGTKIAGRSVTKTMIDDKAKLAAGMRDAHSAARGLASGFGAMWLTWGNILPLMAGAGISAGVVQMVKAGAEVQQNLASMRVLGDESASSISGLNTQMLELARSGPFGPREISAAMKTMTLAGMSAVDVAGSLKDTLNFSVAGDTGIQQAADTLTTVAKAFGVGAGKSGMAGGFAYVGDIISKAAAESKASVEDMSNAFKTASAINQQFGVTLEDTAVGLALLANAGIRGTAAGTSLRNMVSDLSGRTKHAAAAMKELGVEAIDPATGKVKDLGLVMDTLMVKLQGMSTASGALKYLQTIFDERGAKEAYAMFDALQTKAWDTGTSVATVYSELKDKIVNAGGFAAIAAAEMALTPLNQMKSVGAALQATLVESFDAIQPYLIETAGNLRAVFASEGFKSSLQDLAKLVGYLTVLVTEHGRALAGVLLAYMGFRAVLTVIAEVQAVSVAWAAANAAIAASAGAAGVAVTELGLAARIAMAANPLLIGMSAAITLVAVAWGVYEMTLGKSSKTTQDDEGGRKELIRNLGVERDRLKEINEARALGITLEEYKANKGPKGSIYGAAEQNIAGLRSQLADASDPTAKGVLQRNLDKALKDLEQQKLLTDFAKYEVKAEGRTLAKSQAQELADRLKAQGKLYTGASSGPADTSGKGHAQGMENSNDNSLENTLKRYKAEMSVIKEQEDSKSKLLSQYHSAGLLTDSMFYVQEEALAAASADRTKAQTQRARQEYMDGYKKLHEDAEASFTAWVTKNPKATADQLKAQSDRVAKTLGNLGRDMVTVMAGFNATDQKTDDTMLARLDKQAVTLAGNLVKMKDAYRDATRATQADDAKKLRATATEDSARYASPRAAAGIAAAAAAYEQVMDSARAYDVSIRSLNDQIEKNTQAMYDQGAPSDEQLQFLDKSNNLIKAQISELQKLKNARAATAPGRAEEARKDSYTKFDKESLKPVGDNLRQSLVDGIRTGFKEGKNFGDTFAKGFGDVLEQRMVQGIMDSTVNPLVDFAMNQLSGLLNSTMSKMPTAAGGGGGGWDFIQSLFSANGNAFGGNGVHAFANGGAFTNGIYSQATPFMFASGGSFKPGVMGEAGDEAVMPLTRGAGGKLGVQASGVGGGSNMVVNIIESPGNGGKQNRRTENGVDVLDVFVEKVKSSIAGDISRGTGAVPNAMSSTYGLNRVAGSY